MMTIVRWALCSLLAGALTVACKSPNRSSSAGGALDVIVLSDMALPKDLDKLSLRVTQQGQTLLDQESALGSDALRLPATFEVKATTDASPVMIRAVGYEGGTPRVERDAITPIPSGYVGELRLALNFVCVGTAQLNGDGAVSSTCPDGQTCVNGACKTSNVPASDVPPVSTASNADAGTTDAGTTDAGAAAGCFDVAACFDGATAATVDTTLCRVTLPKTTSAATLNLGLEFPVGGPGICSQSACWISLTDWTLDGNVVDLPAAVCESASSQGGVLVVSTACHPQLDTTPVCGAWSSVSTPVMQPPSVLAPSCTGPTTRSCGSCGTQSRACINGEFGPWGVCTDLGVCEPGSTQKCGSGGTQTCTDECQWAECGCSAEQLTCGAGECASASDVHSCGSCTNDCTALPHVTAASASCAKKKCSYSCEHGFADCDGDGRGCGADLAKPATCGSCSNDCTSLPHVSGTVTCAQGKCLFDAASCTAGWGDCNGDPSDGCETALDTLGQCGACNKACTGVDAICDASTKPAKCGSSCAGTICGTSCVSTNVDATHCGSCDTSCTAIAHAQPSCVAGKCALACNTGYTACANVCVDVTSDPTNCGACGVQCATGATCTTGVCNCQAGAHACNGACVSNILPTSCGTSSCTACPAPSGGAATCNGTSCGETCPSGLTLCGGSCLNIKTDAAHCGSCSNACPSGSTCAAGACTCSGASTMSCGTCGTQQRTCTNGVWSAWSSCVESGCTPNTSQTCAFSSSVTGAETCSATCQWSSCCNPAPYQIISASVMFDPASGLHWQRTGTKNPGDYPTAYATCAALGGSWRLPTWTELMNLMSASSLAGEGPMPAVNTCAFALQFQTNDHFSTGTPNPNSQNIYWIGAGAPPCTGNSRVADLYTGQTYWFDNCAANAGFDKALCVY